MEGKREREKKVAQTPSFSLPELTVGLVRTAHPTCHLFHLQGLDQPYKPRTNASGDTAESGGGQGEAGNGAEDGTGDGTAAAAAALLEEGGGAVVAHSVGASGGSGGAGGGSGAGGNEGGGSPFGEWTEEGWEGDESEYYEGDTDSEDGVDYDYDDEDEDEGCGGMEERGEEERVKEEGAEEALAMLLGGGGRG